MKFDVGWLHPVDSSDQWDGFNEPGIEHFRGSPLAYLAREVTQNSLDAAVGSPVSLAFRRLSVSTASIPNIDELRETFKICDSQAANESAKAAQFFRSGVELLSKNKLSILQIVDRNTSGISGPCENGYPFYAFMKASGQSVKNSPTATGSYGIGKFAPYAASLLRTTFVSTVYSEADKKTLVRLTQGKSILMSHDVGVERRRGLGFWGIRERCKPLVDAGVELPDWLCPALRSEGGEITTGTTLVILGFDGGPKWKELLAAALAENFFGALHDSELVVNVDDKLQLDSSNVSSYFHDEYREVVKTEKGEPERIENCALYHDALSTSSNVVVEQSQQREFGLCEIRILIRDGLPKRVAFLRNGMYITDQLDGLKRFTGFKDFVAVVECKSDKGNELLRKMEPPKHNDFEPERLVEQKEILRGKKALRELTAWVRDILKRHAKDPVSDVTTVDELTDYFGDEDKEAEGSAGREKNPEGKVVITAKPLPYKVNSVVPRPGGDEGGGDGGGNESGANGGEGGSGSNQDDGKGGATKNAGIGLNNVRAVSCGSNLRHLYFTPTSSAWGSLRLSEIGADSEIKLTAVDASLGKISKNGEIELQLVAGERISLEVTLARTCEGAIGVFAREI